MEDSGRCPATVGGRRRRGEKLTADPDFNTLQCIARVDDLVTMVPGAQPFPR